MKKVTIITLSLMLMACTLYAQHNTAGLAQCKPMNIIKADLAVTPENMAKGYKALDDTIWYCDFSNPANWVFSSGPTATDGSWQIGTNTGNLNTYDNGSTFHPPTKANGFAFINAIQYLLAPPVPIIDAYITWAGNPIDLSNNPGVVLAFWERYRAFNHDDVYVEVSTNNTDWTQYQLHADIEVNNFYPGDYTEINISSIAGGSPTVWIRFHFEGLDNEANYGAGYGWRIDDVLIKESPDNDLKLKVVNVPYYYQNTGFVYILPKYYLGWYRPAADIENNGYFAQTDVSLNCSIVNEAQIEVYNWTTDSLGSWASGTHDTLWMDSVFEPPYMKADYTATFTVSQQESEQKPEDNTMNISFLVRDSVYAHDQGIQTSEIAPSMYDGAADGDAMGTQFFVPIDDTVSSISVFIDDETTVGTMMTAELWKYDDVIGQWVLVIDGEEHIIEAADIDNWVTMKLTSEDGLQEYILGNTFYSAMISCTWGTDILWLGDDKSNTFVHAYNWETSLRLGTTWYWTTNTPMVRLNFCRSGIGCEPLMANVVPTNEICFGANDGTATALTAGGDGNFQYVWSNGGTNSSINNLAPGTYSVTITSPICLQDTVINFTISGSSQILNVSYVKTNPTCGLNNGTIDLTVTGGEVPYSFTWSNGATTANPDNLAEGSYYYTVTDYFGCEKTGFITLSDPFYLNFSMVATHISCFGQTDGSINLSVSGNGSPFTYVWSNSATTQDISGLSQGTYYVTITDVNGCTKVGSKGITEPALLETTLNATDISCFGVNDGSIDIVVSGGIAPYSFTWSTGATTEPLNNLAENIYYVTVSDHNSCPTVDSAEIAEPPLLESIIIHSDVICFGSANGSANLTGSGGTQPYSFIWSNGQTTEDIDSLLQGIYSVTVTDAHNCVTYNTTTIGTDPLITLSISTTNASCGASDGTATITPSGGVLPFNYSWGIGQTTATAIDLAAGAYYVTLTDAHGCTIDTAAIISNYTTLTANINIFNNVSCNGFCDGDATITASQGAPGYSYLWSSGQSTVTAGNLCPGTYIVTVTDSENCMAIDQITITQPNILQSDVTGPDLFCYGDADSDIDLSVTGGTSPYSYSWSNGATTQDISNLAAGSYSITITDANDCEAFDGITINQPAALTASFDNTMISCNGANNGEINLNISEGTSPYSYLWTTGDTIEDLSTLGPGFYFVTITDAHGCTIMALTTITEPDILAVTYTSHNPWNGNNGDIDLEVSGGTEPYSYLWNDGTTTEDRTGLAAGNYSVVVTDANSCTALSSSIVLTTGINETDVIKPIAVYPNPTKGLLHIDNAANATITIYDMLGKVVMGVKKASDKFTFDLSKKPEGAYFVKIITNNKTITRKIILTK